MRVILVILSILTLAQCTNNQSAIEPEELLGTYTSDDGSFPLIILKAGVLIHLINRVSCSTA